jgi:WD40 repeat protein
MRKACEKRPLMPVRRLPASLAFGVLCALASAFLLPGSARSAHGSDQNHDDVVNLADLILYSQNQLGQDWQTVDWCGWLEQPHKREKKIRELLDFVDEYFSCSGGGPLAILNVNDSPTRLAWSPDGQRIYVSDARVGSVFIYDSVLTPLGELKGLGKPLGVAVDPAGNIYVGDNESDDVSVYSPAGMKTATIGAGVVQMPNDLAFDADGKLYVADSARNRVWVFDPVTGESLGSIGVGELRFPSAVTVSGQELFVGDQGNFSVKVFDLQGNLLRTLGGEVGQGSLGYKWKGKFVRLQSLAIDATGRLHALDSHMGVIQILDASSGAFVASYGSQGTAPGELNLPLDIAIDNFGTTAVANTRNERVELLTAP